MPTDELLSFHESGHAVVALALGMVLSKCRSIRPNFTMR